MPVTPATRHFTASAVVLDVGRRLVLVVAHKATGRWQLPGGHIDPDETGAEAAAREVREETGVRATIISLDALAVPGGTHHPNPLMTVEFPAPAKPAKGEPAHHHIDLLYVAVADSTAPLATKPDEVDGARWLPIDRLGDYDLREDDLIEVERHLDAVEGDDLANIPEDLADNIDTVCSDSRQLIAELRRLRDAQWEAP